MYTVAHRLSQLRDAVLTTVATSMLRGIPPEYATAYKTALSICLCVNKGAVTPSEIAALQLLLEKRCVVCTCPVLMPMLRSVYILTLSNRVFPCRNWSLQPTSSQLQGCMETLAAIPKLLDASTHALSAAFASDSAAWKAERSSTQFRAWRDWMRCPDPEDKRLPVGGDFMGQLGAHPYHPQPGHPDALSPTQHLMFVLAARPECGMAALRKFAQHHLPPGISRGGVDSVLLEAHCTSPILFLSESVDEAEVQLRDLCAFVGAALTVQSVGVGQRLRIEAGLRKAAQDGAWYCMTNCQLTMMQSADDDTASLLYSVEAFVRGLEPTERRGDSTSAPAHPSRESSGRGAPKSHSLHPSFRLCLITDARVPLPESLVQLCVPVAVDSTPANLCDSIRIKLQRLPPGVLETIEDTDNAAWRKLVFTLAVLHAAVRGRGKFGRAAWTRQYKFSTTDFVSTIRVVCHSIRDQQQELAEVSIPWRQMQFTIAECMVGGRVTDSHDMRVLRAFADVWLHDVSVQPGYLFKFCETRTVDAEQPYTALGWLTWKDREPPTPALRGPHAPSRRMSVTRGAESTTGSRVTGGGGGAGFHGHRKIVKSGVSPTAMMTSNAAAVVVNELSSDFCGPSDSDVKDLGSFQAYLDRLAVHESPVVSGFRFSFRVV